MKINKQFQNISSLRSLFLPQNHLKSYNVTEKNQKKFIIK